MSYDYKRGVHICNGCGAVMPSMCINPPYVSVTRVAFPDRQHGIGGGLTFCEACEPFLMAALKVFCASHGGGFAAVERTPEPPPPDGVCPSCRHTGGKHLQSCPRNPAR